MSMYVVYGFCIWLPILVPAGVIFVASRFHLNLAEGVIWEILAYSLVYGGIPYAALAVWATWWIRGRPEHDIRRLMFRAPLIMIAVFAPLALVVGLVVGAPVPFAAVAVLGSVIILLLGYAYVALTVLLRWTLRPS